MNDYISTICPKCLEMVEVDHIKAEIDSVKCFNCQEELSLDGVVTEVNDESLRELVKKASIPVIVDFYANWCIPCREFAPTFSKVAYQHLKEYIFVKISAEFNPVMAQSFNIKGIPHTVLFKNGQEVGRKAGALLEKDLELLINQKFKVEQL